MVYQNDYNNDTLLFTLTYINYYFPEKLKYGLNITINENNRIQKIEILIDSAHIIALVYVFNAG